MYNIVNILYSINGVGYIGQIHAKKKETDHFLIPYTDTKKIRLKT